MMRVIRIRAAVASGAAWMIVAGAVFGAQAGSSYLAWQEGVRLGWNDFMAAPDGSSPPYQGAGSQFSTSMHFECVAGVPDFRVVAEFDRNRSWARPGMPESLLAHEQLHFDIAEVYVRRTEREFGDVERPCDNMSAIRDLVQRNDALAAQVQRLYDDETVHGTRADAQADWARRIRILLVRP